MEFKNKEELETYISTLTEGVDYQFDLDMNTVHVLEGDDEDIFVYDILTGICHTY